MSLGGSSQKKQSHCQGVGRGLEDYFLLFFLGHIICHIFNAKVQLVSRGGKRYWGGAIVGLVLTNSEINWKCRANMGSS